MAKMMQVSVDLLAKKYCNPLKDPPWDLLKREIYPISDSDIELRLKRRLKRFRAYDSCRPESRSRHIERIAWYVANGWGDSFITLDFNQDWLVYDGNHRLGAAIYLKEDMIWADVYGSLEEIRTLY